MADFQKKTPEQLEAEKTQMLEKIKGLAENFEHKPEDIAELIAFRSKFYQYSLNNQMLIYSQNPRASFVGSFTSYKDKGYSVNKGEKGLKIFVPVTVKYVKHEDEWIQLSQAPKELQKKAKEGSVEVRQSLRFKLGSVFDISQTNCPVEDYPKVYNMGYTSEQHAQVFEGLVSVCREQYNCNVSIENYHSIGLRGLSYLHENKISLNEKLQDSERVSTLSHELGHFLLHHGDAAEGKHPSQAELEADIYSIMLQSHLGVELTDSRKSHLAEHYMTFKAYTQQLPEGTDVPTLQDSLNIANEAFKNSIEKIDEAINKAQPKQERPSEEKYAYAEVTQVQLEKLEKSDIQFDSRSSEGKCIVRFEKENEAQVEKIIAATKGATMAR